MKSAKTKTAPLHVGHRMDDGDAFIRSPMRAGKRQD